MIFRTKIYTSLVFASFFSPINDQTIVTNPLNKLKDISFFWSLTIRFIPPVANRTLTDPHMWCTDRGNEERGRETQDDSKRRISNAPCYWILPIWSINQGDYKWRWCWWWQAVQFSRPPLSSGSNRRRDKGMPEKIEVRSIYFRVHVVLMSSNSHQSRGTAPQYPSIAWICWRVSASDYRHVDLICMWSAGGTGNVAGDMMECCRRGGYASVDRMGVVTLTEGPP